MPANRVPDGRYVVVYALLICVVGGSMAYLWPLAVPVVVEWVRARGR